MGVTTLPRLPNQGQMIAAGWNNASGLTDFTALFGTDNLRFAPVYDREYSTGIMRQLTTGGTIEVGFPKIRITLPYISYGQLDYLLNTLGSGSESFNATYRGHKPDALNAADVTTWNVICNLSIGQLPNLTKRPGGYAAFIIEVVLLETI